MIARLWYRLGLWCLKHIQTGRYALNNRIGYQYQIGTTHCELVIIEQEENQ